MNKTAKSFGIVTGFSVLTRAISFIFKIWVSRALGAEVVGLYQIALSVMMMLFTLTSGAPTVLSRKVAEAASVGDVKRQNSLTTASLIMGLGISALLCGILYALNSKLGFLFSDERCLPIFLIMLPTLITSTLYASFRSWFWGRKNFLAFSSTELLDEIVKIILSVVFAGGLATFISGANGLALAMTLSDAICVLVLAVLFFISGGRFAKPSGFKELISRTVPLSATRIITSVASSLTAVVIPQMLVKGGLTVSAATAEYGRVAGMALPLIMAPVMFVSSLSVVLIPDVAELKAKGDMDTVRKKLSGAMTFALLIAAVFFVVYLPLGKQIGALLFGDDHAGTLVSNCSVMLFPIAIAQVTTPMLNSLGKERVTFVATLVGALATLPCIFLLPKYVGVYAMAIASTICFLLICVINMIALKKEVGSFIDGKKFVKTIAFSIPLAVLGVFSSNLLSKICGNIVSTIVLIIFLVFFLFIFISAFEIADVVGYIRLLRPAYVAKTSKKPRSRKRARAKRK
ncbi:MAG: oligosaccharide flippase family protein [Bacteroides sp.]|nr:oligosaccharide flippase family protein [Bacillota bacterium]MCM1394323.1 oligosaccharide flippase family protein [[Eubacterium] siraeum]MCM1454985.1 oligosaccharide flippase family protein [Bacteroides sp.]